VKLAVETCCWIKSNEIPGLSRVLEYPGYFCEDIPCTRCFVSTSHSCQSLTQDGPKGCYDIGLPSKKPLFQIFAWLLVWLFHLGEYQRKEVHFAEHKRVWPLESMQYLAISWAGGEDSAFGHHVQRGGILNVTNRDKHIAA